MVRTAFSPDGSLVATVSYDGTARTFRAVDGQPERTFTVGSGLYAVAFAPGGAALATGGFDRMIRLWNVTSGALLFTFPSSGGYIQSLRYTADGGRLLSGTGYPAPWIRAWDPATGSLVRTLTANSAGLRDVEFTADAALVATAAHFERMVRVHAAGTGQLVYAWDTGTGAYALGFSPDNQFIAMPGANNTVAIRRLSDGALIRTLTGHAEEVTGLAFSHDGALLAAGSTFPGAIRLWRTSDWSFVREIPHNPLFGPLASLTFSPDDALLGGAAEAAPFAVRVADGALVAMPAGTTNSVAFSPDGQLFVVSGGVYQNQVRIYSVGSWTLVRTLPTGANDVAFSADGQHLFVAHLDALRIWRTSDWSVVRTYDQELGYTGSTESVQTLAVAPDAARFAYGREDATLVVAANPLTVRLGDLNCDGAVDFDDINPFVLALSDPAAYLQQFPHCNPLNGDANADGRVDFDDINPFVALLAG
ncbi:MAG: hypothetical protein AB1716_05770 [Planctomycetota bacterium]